MKKITLLLILFISISCSPTKYAMPTISDESIPELNTNTTKEIGETLVKKSRGYFYDAIDVKNEYKMSNTHYNGGVHRGVYYLRLQKSKHDIYFPADPEVKVCVAISQENGEAKIYTPSSSSFFRAKNFSIDYTKTTYMKEGDNSYVKEFIFNGKVGNALKFTYREYFDDLARPAFTQELQYDLSESNIIGFKGLRIEVIKATNTNIEYKVLKHFE